MPDPDSIAAISSDPTSLLATSALVEQAFTRASGAPLVKGNAVRLLKDGEANYAAWVEAINAARHTVFFENYIIEDDEVGRELASALADRARAGVKVRLVRDWFGSLGGASGRFWRRLTAAGADVRVFNRPRIGSPLGWLSRDHRKTIAVDGEVAFVTGLCVSNRWLGDPKRGIPPWRDTGVEIRGPAVGFVERAFAEVWTTVGGHIPPDELADPRQLPVMGDVPVRVIAGTPRKADLFRIDQLIACAAQRTLWLTDAYFVGFAPYVQALCAAAQDRVDVRLLVPSASDLPLVAALSRAGYRPLIEAGVRVFEWNGSMLHAKTAVADGRWARVGSSNLNLASFISNYEIDVAIEHDGLAREMEAMYLADLENATEIIVGPKRRIVPEKLPPGSSEESTVGPRGASGWAVGAVRFAHAVGNVIIRSRVVGFAQSSLMVAFGALLLALTAVSVLWPRVVASPFAVLAAWLGVALVVNGVRLRRQRRRVGRASA
ncbi:MAG TPA: phospholipase D-like domain-containing protein [Polyangia bacterium]|nr:phospholipase D-like domain-containing protein [Polyangia bacterium]